MTRLRIAIVSTCSVATPPVGYGGTELVVADLAEALAMLGHELAVFATGDSTCVGARASGFARPVWPPNVLAEVRHAANAWEEIARGRFDVVHVNDPSAIPFTRFVPTPTVATIHHERFEDSVEHYAAYPDVHYVAISERHADLLRGVPIRAVIRHGIDVRRHPAGPGGGGYCAFVGRLAPEKGPHLAIDAARKAGRPILLGGEAHETARDYFRESVEPRIAADARLLGELDQERKNEVVGRAECLLFPIEWEEPFGLVMVEAMLMGTPVVAFRRGSAPEVVDEGITGYVVDDLEQMARRIGDVRKIDRARCRARALERWGSSRMAQEYLAVYRAAIEARARPLHETEADGRRRAHA